MRPCCCGLSYAVKRVISVGNFRSSAMICPVHWKKFTDDKRDQNAIFFRVKQDKTIALGLLDYQHEGITNFQNVGN
jgi:hypothetical protein